MLIRTADLCEIIMENAQKTFSASCAQWQDVTVEQQLVDGRLLVTLQAEETPVRLIRLRWHFAQRRKEALRIYGDEWERGYGTMAWQGIKPERCMPWVCAASNGSDREESAENRLTECFGVMTQPAAFCLWQYDPQGVTLWMDVRNGGEGVHLHGRKLKVCSVVMSEYRNLTAFQALKAFYHTLCPAPLQADHRVYGSNNWYYAYGHSSQEEILRDTDLVASLCQGLANPPYMVIDDGWSPNACDGPWHCGNARFPDMKALCDAMKAKGVRPGIWIRYLSDKARQTEGITPEMRLSRDDTYLDPSHPEVLKKVARDTRRLTEEWGFQLIKHDFSTYDIMGYWGFERKGFLANDGWHFFDQSKTTAEIILTLYQTIRRAAGEKTVLLGCNVIGHLAAGLVHLNRTGDDTSGREWERTRVMGVNTLAFRMLHDEAFYDADADCVGIMGPIDWQLNGEWLRALAASGTPLFVSCKPDVPNEAELADLRAAFARASQQKDALLPLDWMENTCPEEWLLNGEHVHFSWYPALGSDVTSVL